jgi:hypothetical protein
MGTVLIGGLISSLVLTLALVPVIYTLVMGRSERRPRTTTDELSIPSFEPASPALRAQSL